MITDFLRPSDPRWTQALRAARHDVYDLPAYLSLCAASDTSAGGAEATAFYAAENGQYCLIPLLRRPLPAHLSAAPGWTDAISPYGYSGALFAGEPGWAAKAVRAFAGVCADRKILSVLVRLHPLLPPPEAALETMGVRVTHGETVWVDLSVTEAALRANIRPDHRAGVRRLRRDGFRARIDDWSLYGRYIAIYHETMQRLEADPYYHFPQDYFTRLKEAWGPHLHLISVLAPDGALAAAGLFSEIQGIVQFHLSGTAEGFRQQAPSKLMLDTAIEWAKTSGNQILHLGGGLGARQDSLYQFKAGFSRLRSRFETWRIVCDAGLYAEIARTAAGPEADYFPAYRKAA